MITSLPHHCACELCRQASTTIETLTKINAELYKLVETQVLGHVAVNITLDRKQVEPALSEQELVRHYAKQATAMAWAELSKRLEKHVDLYKHIDELKMRLLLGPNYRSSIDGLRDERSLAQRPERGT
jgi:hypothetical protein